VIIFVFTAFSQKIFDKVPNEMRCRILKKLKELKSHNNIFSILRRPEGSGFATHRLRVGDYRLILRLTEQKDCDAKFVILDVGHRSDVYKWI
jgi:mRNA-degrading endonuclease RelE of RelBE toxin-antitoxin system